MLSGPDMGAGFLYQLTVERAPGPARFVFHAQDGGVDANGPPKGTPEPFGWAPSPSMCPLGGRTCWHREFWLPEAEALCVRTAYNRTRFVMEASLEQAYGGRPAPVDAALEELLRTTPGTATGPPDPWWLGGASSLWVQDTGPLPDRLEVETTERGVRWWAGTFEEYLIEPPAPTVWYSGRRRFGARAFLGTLRVGARVEWSVVAGGSPTAPHPREEGAGRWADWRGHRVPARSPAWVLRGAAEANRSDLVEAALAVCARAPGSREEFDALLQGSELTGPERDSLRRRLAAAARR